MNTEHTYTLTVKWTGNTGEGTSNYRAYSRNHTVKIPTKIDLFCSADPEFRGDKTRHNPEEMLVASISSCHMLWYLHLCADAGVIVLEYIDDAQGILLISENGGGKFTEVRLNPKVRVRDNSMIQRANELHEQAHKLCFIANSCNFPIFQNPTCSSENA